MGRVRQWIAGWSPAQRGKIVRWASAGGVAFLAVVCVVVAGWRLPKDDSAQPASPEVGGARPAVTTPLSPRLNAPLNAPLSASPATAAPSVGPSAPPAPPALTSLTVTGTRALGPGESVRTDRTKLLMQPDGNLVILDQNGKTLWKSNTTGTGNKTVFQGDGNLVVYDSRMSTAWSTRTDGHDGATLVLQKNGDVCVVYHGKSLWCAGTAH